MDPENGGTLNVINARSETMNSNGSVDDGPKSHWTFVRRHCKTTVVLEIFSDAPPTLGVSSCRYALSKSNEYSGTGSGEITYTTCP